LRARGVIIQDRFRAAAFYDQHVPARPPMIYYPVSVRGYRQTENPRSRCSRYWHVKYSLAEDVVVVLYFGALNLPDRALFEFVSMWHACDPKFVLVLHGPGKRAALCAAAEAAPARNIFVSDEFVSEEEIPSIISSAQIGLCYYSNELVNDRLTAYSSEKIALCLRAGVPIITNDNVTYRDLFSRFPCGESLAGFEKLPDVLKLIRQRHGQYRQAALDAFDSIYSLERNAQKLIAEIGKLCDGAVPGIGVTKGASR
jgi:hypothetical protein